MLDVHCGLETLRLILTTATDLLSTVAEEIAEVLQSGTRFIQEVTSGVVTIDNGVRMSITLQSGG